MADANLLLTELQGCRAFILYRLERAANGDLDKIPTSPYTGKNCDPHDPCEWMLGEEAALWAEQYGASYGVGVVISEDITLPNGGKLFCLDLDKCRDGDRWLPHAAAFCSRFGGALTECSVSGTGLHVFGSYFGERPEHGVKNKVYKIELYTRLRFIAITGVGASGSCLIDHTKALHALAVEYFPKHDDEDYGDTLSDKPVAEWVGPSDDDELLRRAFHSNSFGAIFRGKASFADLFTGNADALSRVFPAFKNTPWDYSAADQALANHLAFWTGNHGMRIERIMRRSGLVRDKWDVRPTYLRDTINRACGSQRQWYKDPRGPSSPSPDNDVPPPPAPVAYETATTIAATTSPTDASAGAVVPSSPTAPSVPPPPDSVASAHGHRPPVGDYLTLTQQLPLFDGCIYVQDVHQILMPAGHLLSSERFDTEFAGYTFAVTADGQRPAKKAWEAFVHSEVHSFPKVRGTYFDPRQEPRALIRRDGWTFINSWVPVDIPKKRGDASPFLNHLRKILPKGNDADILLAYFAACVQFPGYKFQWWPLIQGVEGNGKTLLSVLLEMAVGARYAHWPKAAEVGSKFNAAFYGKILVLVEDVYISEQRGTLWETLKPMITGARLEIESKGVDKVMREVCFNGVLNTNHKNGIRKTRNDRRICPFFCAQQFESDLERDGLTQEYFVGDNGFKHWVYGEGGPIVADFLASYQIPDQWNPTKGAHRAPRTTATEEAITAGLGAVEQEVLEAIEQRLPGFRGGWVSSIALDMLLAKIGKAATIPRNKRRELIESLGYVLHRGLPEGRSVVADTDGSRPIFYTRKDAQGVDETDPAKVLQWFKYLQSID